MGIYSNAVHEGYNGVEPTIQDTLESIMVDESIEPYEGEDFTEGALAAVCDIHENYNLFMNQIGIAELAAVENTGSLMVYTEGVLGDMVNAIKNFLKKIWEKIKSLFKRFMMMIDSYTKNDKEFITKYKKEIYSGKGLEDFSFKGWKFNKDAFTKTKDVCDQCTLDSKIFNWQAGKTDKTEEELKRLEEKYDDMLEDGRGKIISLLGGKSGKYDSSEFTKELHAVFRSGEESKEELDDKDINAMGGISGIANELMTSSDLKKTINNNIKAAKKAINTDEKEVERKQNEFFKSQPMDKDEADKETKDYSDFSYTSGQKGSKGHTETEDEFYDRISKNGSKMKKGSKNFKASYDANKQTTPDIPAKDASFSFGKTTNKEVANRKAKSFSIMIRAVRDTKSVLLQVEGACLNALKERSRQNKAIIIKYVAHKPKKESGFTESVQMGYTPFSNIVLR